MIYCQLNFLLLGFSEKHHYVICISEIKDKSSRSLPGAGNNRLPADALSFFCSEGKRAIWCPEGPQRNRLLPLTGYTHGAASLSIQTNTLTLALHLSISLCQGWERLPGCCEGSKAVVVCTCYYMWVLRVVSQLFLHWKKVTYVLNVVSSKLIDLI